MFKKRKCNKLLTRDKLYYLASPYTHTSKAKQKQRLRDISKVGGILVDKNIHCIMPICSSVEVAKVHKTCTKFDYWKELDLLYVKKCDGLIIANLPGWHLSVGVKAELEYARVHNKDVYILNTKDLLENNKLNVRKT